VLNEESGTGSGTFLKTYIGGMAEIVVGAKWSDILLYYYWWGLAWLLLASSGRPQSFADPSGLCAAAERSKAEVA
jgi:hypothetical protein